MYVSVREEGRTLACNWRAELLLPLLEKRKGGGGIVSVSMAVTGSRWSGGGFEVWNFCKMWVSA